MTVVVASPAQFGAIHAALPGASLVDPQSALPPAAVLVWLDGLTGGEVHMLEAALASRGRTDVAVMGERADGFNDPPLASLCRGLIAGFGHDGLRAGARFLDSST